MPNIKAEVTDQGLDYWASRPYLKEATRERLRQAEVILLPREGFQGKDLLTFPVRTEEFYGFLKRELGEDHPVDLAIEEEDYQELALHGALYDLGLLFVGGAFAGLVSIITDYINRRAEGKKEEATVRVQLIVQEEIEGVTRSVKLSYDGSADEFQSSMQAAIQNTPGVALSAPKPLPPQATDADA